MATNIEETPIPDPIQSHPANPHAIEPEAVLDQFGVDAQTGLAGSQVSERLARYGPNILRQRKPQSLLWLLISQFNSPVVYLLLAAAGLALAMGEVIEFITIIIVLVINAAIGFVMEVQAVRSMEALRKLTTHSTLVRRDGIVSAIPAGQLVPGDIAILDAGDIVAADMRIVASAHLAADESPLTGESLPVIKTTKAVDTDAILAERPSMLFKGCAIIRGTGEAVVTGTGMNTELGRITQLVAEAKPERSPLEHQLAKLSRDLIWVTLAITVAVCIAGIIVGQETVLMLQSAVALAVAAIPEGLPIVATLALARGMLRMARHNALIEQLSAVETLGATTVILTDKTGTITENRMHVNRVITARGEFTLDKSAGQYLLDGKRHVPTAKDEIMMLLRSVALCNNATPQHDGAAATGDPMEIALLEAAGAAGLSKPDLLAKTPEVEEHAFDALTRMMATVHKSGKTYQVAVKGAPEAVFKSVKSVMDGASTTSFDAKLRRQWQSYIDVLADQGLRLIAVAGKRMNKADGPVYQGLTLYGLIGFQDPPRDDIPAAIADARRAGIKVVMVTGDHAATAQHISEAVGLADQGGKAIEGTDLKPVEEMNEAEKAALREKQVFARVDPEQKLNLIALHQQAGEIVAMTGDGVNDAPALQKADIGVAMGMRGTQIAREAADLVLRDDAFFTIIHAVREGRTIYTNIRRFATYLLSCNLSEILVIGLAVIAGLPLPLLPLQILFLNLVTDVFPAFALGTIATEPNTLNRPPRPPGQPILGRPQWTAIALHGVSIAASTLAALLIALFYLGLTGDAVTTMCFFTLALAQLWHVFNMRNWRAGFFSNLIVRNNWVWAAIALCLVIMGISYVQPQIAMALRLTALPTEAWYISLGLSFLPVFIYNLATIFMRMRAS